MKPSAENAYIAQRILTFIHEHNNFMLSAHINADGDAIASMIAVHLLLGKLGKQSTMILSDQRMDNRFTYLKDFNRILSYDVTTHKSTAVHPFSDAAILLDVPGYKRLGEVSALLPDKKNVVKIDHHPSEDELGIIDWADESASSTTALVYEIIELSGIQTDTEMAKAIFTGIAYDTGRFSFSNTTARDLEICSYMVELGAKPSDITNQLFFENSFDALRTIGRGLASLEKYLDGQVNIIYLSLNEMHKSNQNEIEELANYSVAVRGGKLGLFIREIETDLHKVSFRSKCNVDVNVVAKAFNGGGHARAAGCRIAGKKQDIIPLILKEIEKQL